MNAFVAPPLSRKRAWTLALAATFTMAISYFDRQTLAVLAPTVTEKLHISETQYGWLTAAFSIAYLVGAPVAGWLIDRYGARRGLLVAVLVWSFVAALHAVAPSFAALFTLRLALGAAESPSFPGAAQVMTRALPLAERARGFGILFTGSSFGAMLAPPLATMLEARFGYRVAFLGTALVGLLWVPIWLRVAFASDVRPHIDEPHVKQGDVPERRTRAIDLLRSAAMWRTIVVVVAVVPVMGFVLNWGAKYLVVHQAMTQREVGKVLWLPPLLYDVGSITFGDLASRHLARHADRRPARLLLAVAATLGATLVLMPEARSPWQAAAIAAMSLAGCGGLFAIFTSDLMMRVPRDAVSLAGGISAAAQSLVIIAVSPLLGAVVGHDHSYTRVVLVAGAWLIPGALVWIAWKPPAPAQS